MKSITLIANVTDIKGVLRNVSTSVENPQLKQNLIPNNQFDFFLNISCSIKHFRQKNWQKRSPWRADWLCYATRESSFLSRVIVAAVVMCTR